MVQFPPPATSSAADSGEPGYTPAPDRPSFVFPPPRQSSSLSPTEAGMVIGEQMREQGLQAEQALEQAQNLGLVLTDYGDALERKVEPWAVPTIAPLSQTINRRADPVFGLSDFMIPPIGGQDAASGLQQGGNTKGRAYMAFITPAINRAYQRLNFMLSAVTDPCRMDVAVYVLDPDTKLWNRQMLQTNVAVSLGESVATVEFDTPWIATQGSYVAVAWLQHGTGNARFLLGLNDTPRPLGDQVYPHKISAIHTSTGMTGLPATINGTTQTDFSFWFTPYAELSENIGERLMKFTETWGHDSVAPRPWVHLTPTGFYSATPSSNTPVNHVRPDGFSTYVSIYDTPLATKHVRAQTTIAYIAGSSPANPRNAVLIVRGSNNLQSGLGLAVARNSSMQLIHWTGRAVGSDWNDRTVLATIPRAPAVGDTIAVEFHDGMVDVWVNSVHVLVGHPAPDPGPFVGIKVERTGSVFAAYNSPYFGPWSARDLPQDNGDDGEEEGDGEGPAFQLPPGGATQ